MFKKGLFERIVAVFEGDHPLMVDSEPGIEILDSINSALRQQIMQHNATDILLLMRNGKVRYIEDETWNVMADFIEGKFKLKRGPKQKLNSFLTELVFLKVLHLQKQGFSYEEAVDKVCKYTGMSGAKAIEKQFTTGKRNFGESGDIDDPELIAVWGIETQNTLNNYRRTLGLDEVKLFSD